MSGTPSFIHAPGDHTAGVSGPQPRAAPKYFARAEETALGASLNAQYQAPDIPGVSSRADFWRHTLSLKKRISLRAYSNSYWAPSTHKIKLPTTRCRRAHILRCSGLLFTPRIASGIHVFSLKIMAIAAWCLEDYPRRKTTLTLPFTWYLKTVHRNS